MGTCPRPHWSAPTHLKNRPLLGNRVNLHVVTTLSQSFAKPPPIPFHSFNVSVNTELFYICVNTSTICCQPSGPMLTLYSTWAKAAPNLWHYMLQPSSSTTPNYTFVQTVCRPFIVNNQRIRANPALFRHQAAQCLQRELPMWSAANDWKIRVSRRHNWIRELNLRLRVGFCLV